MNSLTHQSSHVSTGKRPFLAPFISKYAREVSKGKSRQAEKYLSTSCRKALKFLEGSDSYENSVSSNASEAAAVRKARLARAAVNSIIWKGKRGPLQKAVLLAHITTAEKSRDKTWFLSVRDIRKLAKCVQSSASIHTNRLCTEGWLKKTKEAENSFGIRDGLPEIVIRASYYKYGDKLEQLIESYRKTFDPSQEDLEEKLSEDNAPAPPVESGSQNEHTIIFIPSNNRGGVAKPQGRVCSNNELNSQSGLNGHSAGMNEPIDCLGQTKTYGVFEPKKGLGRAAEDILLSIKRRGKTRKEIVDETGRCKGTVSAKVELLHSYGIIEEREGAWHVVDNFDFQQLAKRMHVGGLAEKRAKTIEIERQQHEEYIEKSVRKGLRLNLGEESVKPKKISFDKAEGTYGRVNNGD